jgi:hypothetical protein
MFTIKEESNSNEESVIKSPYIEKGNQSKESSL